MNIAGARKQANGSAPKVRKTIMALRYSQNSANPCGSLLHIINDIKALPDEHAAVMTFAEFESYNIKQICIIINKLLDDTDEISLQLARWLKTMRAETTKKVSLLIRAIQVAPLNPTHSQCGPENSRSSSSSPPFHLSSPVSQYPVSPL